MCGAEKAHHEEHKDREGVSAFDGPSLLGAAGAAAFEAAVPAAPRRRACGAWGHRPRMALAGPLRKLLFFFVSFVAFVVNLFL